MIFIVRKRALGDVIWVEPFLHYIINNNKGKRIFIYTKYPQVFDHYPYRKLIVQENPKWYIKVLIRFLAKIKSNSCYILDDVYEEDPQKHFLQAFYDRFNIHDGYMHYPSLQHLLNAKKTVKRKQIVFHVNNTAIQLYRKIHGVNWGDIFQHVHDLGFEILLLNKPEEVVLQNKNIPITFFSGSLQELVNAVNESSYFVGLDSGPSHVAASLKIPSLIFFGPVKPEYRHFIAEFRGYFLQSYCEKAGCYHIQPKWEQVCLLHEDQSIVPKCTIFNDTIVTTSINKLISNYEV